MLKKLFTLLLTILCCSGCGEEEDETVDITVMPAATAIGANTFGCLIDGWVYVGGRYSYTGGNGWFVYEKTPSIAFVYNKTSGKIEAGVQVKRDVFIRFTIASPQEGEKVDFTNTQFNGEKLKDGKVTISRFDQEKQIISGTFEGGRMEQGRFDVRYQEVERPEPPEEPEENQ